MEVVVVVPVVIVVVVVGSVAAVSVVSIDVVIVSIVSGVEIVVVVVVVVVASVVVVIATRLRLTLSCLFSLFLLTKTMQSTPIIIRPVSFPNFFCTEKAPARPIDRLSVIYTIQLVLEGIG